MIEFYYSISEVERDGSISFTEAAKGTVKVDPITQRPEIDAMIVSYSTDEPDAIKRVAARMALADAWSKGLDPQKYYDTLVRLV